MFLKLIRLVALSLFAIKTLAVTGLTTNNCPDNYDLLLANITSDSSTQTTVDLVYSGLYSTNDQAILQQSYSQGDTQTVRSYITDMQILAPFILIAVAFFIMYFVALCCCVF
jgi:hypothetical protein